MLDERSEVVDRKLDLLVGKLKRYGVAVAGVQMSRWFVRDVWPAADGYTFLHSGKLLPGNSETATRSEEWGYCWTERLLCGIKTRW